MRIKGIIVAALAVTLSLAASTASNAFTVAPLDGKLAENVQRIVTDVQAGVVGSNEMLTRIENMIAQIDDLLDAGAVNELELLEARAQLIDARAQVVAKNTPEGEQQLVQIIQAPIADVAPTVGGQAPAGSLGGSFSAGGGGVGSGVSSAGGSSVVGGSSGLSTLGYGFGAAGFTTYTSQDRNDLTLPGPRASDPLP